MDQIQRSFTKDPSKITADEFLKICLCVYQDLPEFKSFYWINGLDQTEITFNTISIDDAIFLNGYEQNCIIRLINCTTSNITIRDSTISEFIIENSSIANLSVGHSSLGSIIVSNSSMGSLAIVKEASVKKLHLSTSQTKMFSISNCKLTDITCEESEIQEFFIRDSSINDISQIDTKVFSTKIKASATNNIIFKNCTSPNSILIADNASVRKIEIDSCQHLNLDLAFRKGASAKSLVVADSLVGSIKINNSTIEKISIKYGSYINQLALIHLGGKSRNLVITNSTIRALKLVVDQAYKVDVLDFSQIHLLELKGIIFPRDMRLQLSETALNTLVLSSFLNNGTIVFNAITPLKSLIIYKEDPEDPQNIKAETVVKKTTIQLVNSDLGKTQFIGCDLEEYDEFVFKNTRILDCFVADTKMPKRTNIVTVNSGRGNLLEQQRLALGQFKRIYESRGDQVRASQYLAEELEVYREQLKLQRPTTRKGRWDKKSELFNLWISRYSNYYGTNWFRGLLMTLSTNLVLYSVYCWSLGYFPGKDVGLFFRLFSYSFEFLNPLRKAEFLVDESHINPMSRIIDYLSRIIVAYFVYQTIQAFRKFGKRNA